MLSGSEHDCVVEDSVGRSVELSMLSVVGFDNNAICISFKLKKFNQQYSKNKIIIEKGT